MKPYRGIDGIFNYATPNWEPLERAVRLANQWRAPGARHSTGDLIMPEQAKYDVRGFVQTDTDKGCDSQQGADTLAEARRIAKHWMTEEYMNIVESINPIVLVQIWKRDELIEERS